MKMRLPLMIRSILITFWDWLRSPFRGMKPENGWKSHISDCTVYAALENGYPTDGICTCGYGWSKVRTGDWSQMYSEQRNANMQNDWPAVDADDVELCYIIGCSSMSSKCPGDPGCDILKKITHGQKTAWDAISCLKTLADAAETLLGLHDYDSHGHEEIKSAMESAREIVGHTERRKTPGGRTIMELEDIAGKECPYPPAPMRDNDEH